MLEKSMKEHVGRGGLIITTSHQHYQKLQGEHRVFDLEYRFNVTVPGYKRDMQVAFKQKAELVQPLMFLLMVVTLFPAALVRLRYPSTH